MYDGYKDYEIAQRLEIELRSNVISLLFNIIKYLLVK